MLSHGVRHSKTLQPVARFSEELPVELQPFKPKRPKKRRHRKGGRAAKKLGPLARETDLQALKERVQQRYMEMFPQQQQRQVRMLPQIVTSTVIISTGEDILAGYKNDSSLPTIGPLK